MSTRGERYRARIRGDKLYYTGRPCIHGHVGDRIVSTGCCLACRREQEGRRIDIDRPAYNTRKRHANVCKHDVLAAKARALRAAESPGQRERRLEQSRERSKRWRELNPNHAGSVRAKQQYAASPQGRGKKNEHTAGRRAAQLRRTPLWLDSDSIWMMQEAYHLAALRSQATEVLWHVDHIIPLQGKYVSGLHVPQNLRVIEAKANLLKGARYIPK